MEDFYSRTPERKQWWPIISTETIFSLSNNCVERCNRDIDFYKLIKRRQNDLGIILSVYEWFCSKEIVSNLVNDGSPLTPQEKRRHLNMQKLIEYQKSEFEKLNWTMSSDAGDSLVQDCFSEEVLNEIIERLKFV